MKCPRCESSRYTPNGVTKAGTPRYRCKECNKTWSGRAAPGEPVRKIGRPRKKQIWAIEHALFSGETEIVEIIEGTKGLAEAWLEHLEKTHEVELFLSLNKWQTQTKLPIQTINR